MKAMVVSPDGNYIYYWSGPNLLKKNLTDSSSPVTVSTLTYGTTVDISPDGTKLLYNNGNAPYYLYEKSISDS